MMKKLILAVCTVVLCSCTDSVEREANEYLVLAQEAYQKGAYEVAREKIDSIRSKFPKAFETRRAALKLQQDIDVAEAQQAVEETDKIIQAKTGVVERMKEQLVLEPITGTVGNYVSKAQTVDKIDHAMLRAQCDEHGLLSLTSVYPGSLDHHAISVSCNGQEVHVPASDARFTAESHGQPLEEVVYSNDREAGVSAFISEHMNEAITLTFYGAKEAKKVVMRPEDVKAVAEVYDFYVQLKTLNDARVRYADACEKIKFVHRNQNDSLK